MITIPLRTKGGYFTWPNLKIKQSREENAGKGVFATRALPVGTMIPIIGKTVQEADDYCWSRYRHNKNILSGNPIYNSYKGVGCFGLAIALMANESMYKKVNCKFRFDYLVVVDHIKAGEELTVFYGHSYEPIRKRKGYSMNGNQFLNDDYPIYESFRYSDFPTVRQREDVLIRLDALLQSTERKSDHVDISPMVVST